MCKNPKGVAKKYTQAKFWRAKAVEFDDAFVQNNLGSLDRDGEGAHQEYAQARAWFEKAATQAEPHTGFMLVTIAELAFFTDSGDGCFIQDVEAWCAE